MLKMGGFVVKLVVGNDGNEGNDGNVVDGVADETSAGFDSAVDVVDVEATAEVVVVVVVVEAEVESSVFFCKRTLKIDLVPGAGTERPVRPVRPERPDGGVKDTPVPIEGGNLNVGTL